MWKQVAYATYDTGMPLLIMMRDTPPQVCVNTQPHTLVCPTYNTALSSEHPYEHRQMPLAPSPCPRMLPHLCEAPPLTHTCAFASASSSAACCRSMASTPCSCRMSDLSWYSLSWLGGCEVKEMWVSVGSTETL